MGTCEKDTESQSHLEKHYSGSIVTAFKHQKKILIVTDYNLLNIVRIRTSIVIKISK